jgi:N-terminal domain of NWD NACHT-NTPase
LTQPLIIPYPLTSQNLAERLWDRAYDDLKADESALVTAYEEILSRELDRNASQSPIPEPQKNVIEVDSGKRRLQMGLLVQVGLKKTEGTAKVKQGIRETVNVILSAKEIIGSAVQTVPQAALAWTGVCFALQVGVPSSNSKFIY